MRHIDADDWSRHSSWLHQLDARAKLIAVLITLAFIGTAHPWSARQALFYAGVAAVGVSVARLSWFGLARRLAFLMPFPLVFAALSWLSTGDAGQAAALVSRSAISASFTLILIGVSTVPALLDAAARLGAPRLLISVAQFLYRYLFVLFEQALRVRQAASCRGGFRWSAAAGAAGALFASSEHRAERIYRSMQARGFQGRDRTLTQPAWRTPDTMLVGGAFVGLLMVRILCRL